MAGGGIRGLAGIFRLGRLLPPALRLPEGSSGPEGGGERVSVLRFLPKLIQRALKADADAIIIAFGKNEQVKKVFWTLFVAMAGIVLARVADPVTAQQVVGLITGMRG
jgi:hypothetical protein